MLARHPKAHAEQPFPCHAAVASCAEQEIDRFEGPFGLPARRPGQQRKAPKGVHLAEQLARVAMRAPERRCGRGSGDRLRNQHDAAASAHHLIGMDRVLDRRAAERLLPQPDASPPRQAARPPGLVGSRGRANSTTLISSTRPGRGAMIAMRSESLIASSMLCVTKITVLRSRCQIFSSSSCMYSRVCMSSDANGSSISRIDGIHRERARDAHALAHAAGQLARIARLEPAQADEPDVMRRRAGPARASGMRLRCKP